MESPESLFNENPQLREREVSPLSALTSLPKLSRGSVRMAEFNLTEHTEYPEDTLVYYLIVQGGGSYIVDNFVSRHELPEFERWPLTYACILAVVRDYVEIDDSLRYV